MSKRGTNCLLLRKVLQKPLPAPLGYLLAIILVGLSIFLNYALYSITEGNAFFLSLAAIVITSLLGGMRPGLVSSVLATLGLNYFFLEPKGQFHLESSADLGKMCLLFFAGLILSFLGGMLKQALAEAESERQRAEAAIRTRDEFISICSHELRTPLTSLKLMAQLCERDWTKTRTLNSANYEKLIHSTIKSVTRSERLISDMLDLSRITHGKMAVYKESMDLGVAVQQLFDSFIEQYRAEGCTMNCQIASGVIGFWDPHRISQIVSNLLSNAIRYGNRKPIEVLVTKRGGEASIVVRDHGRGIAPENKEKIFNRFERLSSMEEPSGLGLGLYITRKIVHLHYGTIHVDSQIGEGSTFTVVLPLSAKSDF